MTNTPPLLGFGIGSVFRRDTSGVKGNNSHNKIQTLPAQMESKNQQNVHVKESV